MRKRSDIIAKLFGLVQNQSVTEWHLSTISYWSDCEQKSSESLMHMQSQNSRALNGRMPVEVGHFSAQFSEEYFTLVGLSVLWANRLLWTLTHPQSNMVAYVFIMVARDRTIVRVRKVRTCKFGGLEAQST